MTDQYQDFATYNQVMRSLLSINFVHYCPIADMALMHIIFHFIDDMET